MTMSLPKPYFVPHKSHEVLKAPWTTKNNPQLFPKADTLRLTRSSLNEVSGSIKLLVSPLPRLEEFPLRGVVAEAEFRDEGWKREEKNKKQNTCELCLQILTVKKQQGAEQWGQLRALEEHSNNAVSRDHCNPWWSQTAWAARLPAASELMSNQYFPTVVPNSASAFHFC